MRNGYETSALALAATCLLPLVACGGTPTATQVSECSNITYAAPSGLANNIVFTLDKAYPCGQYANGDWWVAPPTTGVTVTITAISPAQRLRAASVTNGAMVNPTSTASQGFDGDAPGYSAGQTATVPLAINTTTVPITSVVKAASVPAINRPALQFAAVLTVINAAADKTTQFRPSYFGASGKFQLSVSSINTASLGQSDLTSVPSVAAYTFANVVTATTGLQIDHLGGDNLNEWLHAKDNAYNGSGYGSNVSLLYSKNMMRFASNDFNYSNSTHKQALINYLQYCIDLAGNVNGGTPYVGVGGYGFGRLLPVLFAGQVLQNSTITNLASSGTFGENTAFYKSTATGKILHGEVDGYGPPWTWP